MIKAGVIGNSIKHSKSPMMHNHWLRSLGIAGEYRHVESPIDDFSKTISQLIKDGYAGVNVTIPFKEQAFSIADEVTDVARRMGAANTLVFKDDKIFADNTDGFGFGQNILSSIPDWNLQGRHLVFGAGGAARAVVVWLLDQGAQEIRICNRSIERAQRIAELDGKIKVTPYEEVSLDSLDTLVNTTSRGMNGQNDFNIDFTSANKKMIVNDIVYTPLKTKLLADAQAADLRTVDGLGMLLWQARPGFQAWFGQEPPAITDELRQMMLNS